MDVKQEPKVAHVVASSVPLWGHTKALCGLLARMVHLARVRVTFFIGVSLLDRVRTEVDKQFAQGDEGELKQMIRIVALRESDRPFDFDAFNQAFTTAYNALVAGDEISETPSSERKFGSLNPPQLVILQFFMYEAMKSIRNLNASPVKIFVWQPVSAAGALVRFGPEEYGGNGDLSAKVKAIKALDEKSLNEQAEKIYNRINKEVISIPGLPPMYDYEFSPQQLVRSSSAAFYAQYVYRMFCECDGAIHGTSPLYEGPALELWAKWFGDRPIISVGPITPLIQTPSGVETPISRDIKSFLDNALEQFGQNSVVYISFGTVWWPAEPEKIWIILDVLMELSIPFVFAQASPSGTIPDDVVTKVERSGLGYIASWLPQQMILRHQACGWILTHCGQNSVMEALCEGVPLICWPFLADQPSNAANISFTHNAGYELLEVRSGCGLWPMRRLDDRAPEGSFEAVRREAIEVFTKASGEDGRTKRRNAQRLGGAFAAIWKDDGSGWEEVKKILAFIA